jgi:hypothetical protein
MARLEVDNQRLEDIENEKREITNTEYTGIRLIDNMINDFNLNLNKSKYEAALSEQAQTVNEINTFTGSTDAFARQNANLAKTVTKGTIAANSDKIKANSDIAAGQARLSAMQSNSQSLVAVMNASGRELDANMTMYRLKAEADTIALQEEKMVLTREQMATAREQLPMQLRAAEVSLEQAEVNLARTKQMTPLDFERAQIATEEARNALASGKVTDPLRIKQLQQTVENNAFMMPMARAKAVSDRDLAKKARDDLANIRNTYATNIQEGMAIAGVPIEKNQEAILAGLEAGGALGKRYEEFLLIGMSGSGQIAANPFDAEKAISILAPNGLQIDTKGSKLLEDTAVALAESYNKIGNSAPRDEETQKADFNREASKLQDFLAADIKTSDDSNPYHAPNMDILKTVPAVRDSAFYKKVLANNGKKDFDPDSLFTYAVAGINSKAVTPEEAAMGIAILAKAAIGYNNSVGAFEKYGLKPQITYNTTVTTGELLLGRTAQTMLFKPIDSMLDAGSSLRGGSQSLDISNTSKVMELLIKRKSRASNNFNLEAMKAGEE